MTKISEKTDRSSWIQMIKFAVSALCAVLLIFEPAVSSLVLTFGAYVLILIISWSGNDSSTTKEVERTSNIFTTLLLAAGLYRFFQTWILSSKVRFLAGSIHVPEEFLIIAIGIILCICGFKSVCFTVQRILNYGLSIIGIGGTQKRKNQTVSDKFANVPFAVSGLLFWILNSPSLINLMSSSFPIILTILISLVSPPIWSKTKNQKKGLQLFCGLSAIGICWSIIPLYVGKWQNFITFNAQGGGFIPGIDPILIFASFCSVGSIYFIYVFLLLFWKKLFSLFYKNGIFRGISHKELRLYGILVLATLMLSLIAFLRSSAFYGSGLYDVIYTSDSAFIVRDNAYTFLLHNENDLRQPLFAVFSAPFIGFPCFLANLFGGNLVIRALLMNTVQIVLLMVSAVLLSKMMRLDGLGRRLFAVFFCSTYVWLLFSLMMEQYIIGFFWLCLALYLITSDGEYKQISIDGAGGTLLTSLAVIPFAPAVSPFQNLKLWFKQLFDYGVRFIEIVIICGRIDVLFSVFHQADHLSSFTGGSLSLSDKLLQYLSFVGNCFYSPAAQMQIQEKTLPVAGISWQLNPVKTINWIGLVILCLALTSYILNRKKRSSLCAVLWIVYSAIILIILGWGTKENGLILYGLYFGWAYFVLIYQLVQWIAKKQKSKMILVLGTLAIAVVLLSINLPAIWTLIEFAAQYYPA